MPTFSSGKEVQDYTEAYAEKHSLTKHFQLSTTINENTHNKDDTWILIFPKIPQLLAKRSSRETSTIVASFFKTSMMKGKKVLTIGVRKSGIDLTNHSMVNGAESSNIVFQKTH